MEKVEELFGEVDQSAEFLGLCEKGYVEGIPSGEYSKSKDNMEYGEKAIRLLRDNPELVNEKTSLWRKVAPISLTHNGQMDVVIALCKQGLIRYPE